MRRRFHSSLDLFSAPLQRPDPNGPAVLRIPVLPEGSFSHPLYGKLSWTTEKFTRMIQNFNANVTGAAPVLNADHATRNPFAASAPAYGWPKSMEHVPGEGLFAIIELTDLGEEAITNKRYRYISAEVDETYANSQGATFQDVISGYALTNTPFHDTMPGLFSKAGTDLVQQFSEGLKQFATLEGDLSFDEIRCLLRDAVRAEVALRPSCYRYVEEVFPAFFIYEECDYSGGMEQERHYRRGYTVAGRQVTLDAEVVEVEEVWVDVARQAFATAQKQAWRLERAQSGANSDPAGQPARGKQMSQAQQPTPWQRFCRMLGLGENPTTEQFQAAINSAPAAEGTELKPLEGLGTFSAPAGMVVLSQAEADQLRKGNQEFQEFQRTTATNNANALIEQYARQGKLTPAMREGEAGKALLNFATTNPDAFKQMYDAAPALVELGSRGHANLSTTPSGEGGAETFSAAVAAAVKQFGLSEIEAMEQVANERPELYEAHRQASYSGKA